MPRRTFYAVRPPYGPAVHNTWEECAAAVLGKPGASYRSFPTREEAELWANGGESAGPADPGTLLLYVDGSFVEGNPRAGWGVIAVRGGEELWRMSGTTERDALSRNVDGELEAATRAVEWLRAHPQPALLCHDYEGVARWATGEWKARSEVAARYVEAVRPLPPGLSFRHVEAHAGERWNEAVDSLARSAVLGKPDEKGDGKNS